MTQTLISSFDHVKCFKTIETLLQKVKAFDDFNEHRAMLIQIPTGKNVGRYTMVFAFSGGDQLHWAHRGYKVLG